MSRGGKRPGAGRKKGSETKRTKAAREIADKAIADGVTPLEYMLELMRRPLPDNADAATLVAARSMRFEAAKAAAPYVHPKLQPVDKKGSSDIGVRHKLIVEFLG